MSSKGDSNLSSRSQIRSLRNKRPIDYSKMHKGEEQTLGGNESDRDSVENLKSEIPLENPSGGASGEPQFEPVSGQNIPLYEDEDREQDELEMAQIQLEMKRLNAEEERLNRKKRLDQMKKELQEQKQHVRSLKDGEGEEKSEKEFDRTIYWKKFGDVFKALSHEATKLSVMYSKPPLPSNEECESLLRSAEKVVLAMVSLFYSLPKSQGLTLRRRIKQAVQQSVENVKSLAETISQQAVCSQEKLQSTGIVWEDADNFNLLPKDNKEAVLLVIDRNTPMVDDALKELDEALDAEEDDDGLDEFLGITNPQNDHKWSETDKVLVGYCMGIIKCSKSVLKKAKSAVKANGSCEMDRTISQLDDLVDHVERLSPAVDDLATCVYPPIREAIIHNQVQQLHEVNTNMLNFLKQSHMTTEDDSKWVEFLLKASSHNVAKIETSLGNT